MKNRVFRSTLNKIYKNSQEKYKLDKKEEIAITKINYKPLVVNLFFMGYNLLLFFTVFSNEIDIFLNYWFSFFLLLLNIPLFIYKDSEAKNHKKIAVLMFLCISLFCFPVLYIKQSTSVYNLFIGWLLNYILLIFNNDQKIIDHLKGKTVFFIIFWILILVMSVAIDINFLLPQKYNYAYLINAVYFLTFSYFSYFSNKYENFIEKKFN